MTKRKVLFIHIDFYEYNRKIVDKMCELGYEVDCFCEDVSLNAFEKAFCKINPKYFLSKGIKSQDELICKLLSQNKKYDMVFVIKGEKLERDFLSKLKQINPQARLILYLWDDVARINNFFDNRRFYDKIFTFDRIDATQYGLSFLPLFYCDEFKINNNVSKEIDIFFSGWDHSNRREFIEKITNHLHEYQMNRYFHLFTGRWVTMKRKLKQLSLSREPEYIKYYTLSLEKNAELTKASKILIDIPHPTQKGLTMRTIEALAARAKLITTNNNIKTYDFYTPENIYVIDRKEPAIDPAFLQSPYADIPAAIIENYALASWIRTILGE